MRSQKMLLVKQLDSKLSAFTAAESLIVPAKGWIFTIRTTLNMTLEQLGKKLYKTKQGIKKLETSEAAETITIKSLKELGSALDMKFVYGFIPKDGSVSKLINRKARSLAEKIVLRTNHTMMLEDQAIDDEKIQEAIEELSTEIKLELKRAIWD